MFFSRVTAFAPPDPTKELVSLRKPTVHKVTMKTVTVLFRDGFKKKQSLNNAMVVAVHHNIMVFLTSLFCFSEKVT